MNYHIHDLWQTGLRNYFNILASGTRLNAALLGHTPLGRDLMASAAVMDRFAKPYPKPSFNLPMEEVADYPYCKLQHFTRAQKDNVPKILIVAPMSGHHATLLRDTVQALLPDNDVYISDWKDARDIPVKEGEFGLEDYIDYVRSMLRTLGPDTHVVAVCQPTIPVLAAISVMAAENDPAQPLSMTLMGGPIDTRAAPTSVTNYADKHDINWFRDNVTMTVPSWYKGAGQRVYPGFMQLAGFMMMNPDKHIQSHIDLFNHLRQGDDRSADKIRDFYDEYLAVCDLPAKFYLETVDHVFKKQSLANGTLTHRGQVVDPGKIKKTAIFTVEGALDDIAAPGQTLAAHGLLRGLPRSRHYHYLQEGAGHYGIFNGSRWRAEIAPRIEAFVRKAGSEKGLKYDPVYDSKGAEKAIKIPPLWDGKLAPKPLTDKTKNPHEDSLHKTSARGAGLG